MEKVAESHILTKCCKCNTFQVISDLVHYFMNFNALEIILKIHKNNLERSRLDTQARLSTSSLVHIWIIKENPVQ